LRRGHATHAEEGPSLPAHSAQRLINDKAEAFGARSLGYACSWPGAMKECAAHLDMLVKKSKDPGKARHDILRKVALWISAPAG